MFMSHSVLKIPHLRLSFQMTLECINLVVKYNQDTLPLVNLTHKHTILKPQTFIPCPSNLMLTSYYNINIIIHS